MDCKNPTSLLLIASFLGLPMDTENSVGYRRVASIFTAQLTTFIYSCSGEEFYGVVRDVHFIQFLLRSRG